MWVVDRGPTSADVGTEAPLPTPAEEELATAQIKCASEKNMLAKEYSANRKVRLADEEISRHQLEKEAFFYESNPAATLELLNDACGAQQSFSLSAET